MNPEFQAACEYIWGLAKQKPKVNPQRFKEIMRSLGGIPNVPCLHVAGSNGKGSVCAFCDAALRSSGRRVGLYTSPHLQDVTERIVVDGKPVSQALFAQAVRRARDAALACEAEQGAPFPFEVLTAAALLIFSREAVDVAVVETGLGGRLDQTRLVHAAVTGIASIALEHTALLGDTLRKIAAAKAGIFRQDVPAVIGVQRSEALRELQSQAKRVGAPAWCVQPEDIQILEDTLAARRMDLRLPHGWLRNARLGPLGGYQFENAALAAAMLQLYGVSERDIRAGLACAYWPGRMEMARYRKRAVLLDGAHNAGGARSLAQSLCAYYPDTEITLVLGAGATKDVRGMLRSLLPHVRRALVTQSGERTALSPDALAALIRDTNANLPCDEAPNVRDALRRASACTPSNGLILVCGSLYLVGEARQALHAYPFEGHSIV